MEARNNSSETINSVINKTQDIDFLENRMKECKNKLKLVDSVWENLDWKLLLLAFVHKSGWNKLDNTLLEEIRVKYQWSDCDILEFHGDTILEILVNGYLWSSELKDYSSGDLTAIKSQLTQNKTLFLFMKQYNLDDYIIKDNSINSEKLISDSFEALVGVLYYYLFFVCNLRYYSLDILSKWLENLWSVSSYLPGISTFATFCSTDILSSSSITSSSITSSSTSFSNDEHKLDYFRFCNSKKYQLTNQLKLDLTNILKQRLEHDYINILEPEIRRKLSDSIQKQVRHSLRQKVSKNLSSSFYQDILDQLLNKLLSHYINHFSTLFSLNSSDTCHSLKSFFTSHISTDLIQLSNIFVEEIINDSVTNQSYKIL